MKREPVAEQLDLFTDYAALEQKRKKEQQELEREKRLQHAMLDIKKKFGKNAILKGMNLCEGATAKDAMTDRRAQGHKSMFLEDRNESIYVSENWQRERTDMERET